MLHYFVKLISGLLLSLILYSGISVAGSVQENHANKVSSIGPDNVALVINDADANSVKVGEYYRVARKIPAQNVVHIRIEDPKDRLTLAQFNRLKDDVEKQLSTLEQVVLFAWTAPYAVECNSLTAAFSLGFDADLCKNTCATSKPSPYFNSPSKKPFDDFGIRISMLLPSDSFPQAKALIDRGIQADSGVFRSSAYYLMTSDTIRNSRAQFFPATGVTIPRSGLSVVTMKADQLKDAQDIMIYQTGLASVPGLELLNFLPGALADHLTSFGGDLNGKGQMSILRWLDFGATASYGTVSEPCNHWQKFSNPAVLLKWYASGTTAVEAYWKSVAWPAQGVFVGEPLAAPYVH